MNDVIGIHRAERLTWSTIMLRSLNGSPGCRLQILCVVYFWQDTAIYRKYRGLDKKFAFEDTKKRISKACEYLSGI